MFWFVSLLINWIKFYHDLLSGAAQCVIPGKFFPDFSVFLKWFCCVKVEKGTLEGKFLKLASCADILNVNIQRPTEFISELISYKGFQSYLHKLRWSTGNSFQTCTLDLYNIKTAPRITKDFSKLTRKKKANTCLPERKMSLTLRWHAHQGRWIIKACYPESLGVRVPQIVQMN